MISLRAIHLLWAFLDNKDLWHGLLQEATHPGEDWPGWLHEIADNKVKFLDAVRLLFCYSMIETREDLEGSYAMHPVVHRWTLYIQNVQQRVEFLRLAIKVVGFSVPATYPHAYLKLVKKDSLTIATLTTRCLTRSQ